MVGGGMIRQATADDASVIGDLFVCARSEMAYLPAIPEQVRPLLGVRFREHAELWVVEETQTIVGFAGLRGSELTHLYIHPAAQNRGIGTRLLNHAKQL